MSDKNDVVVTIKVEVGGKKLSKARVTNNVPDVPSGLALLDAVQEQISGMRDGVRAKLSL